MGKTVTTYLIDGDPKITEKERHVLTALVEVLNISYTRAGLIEDFVRRNL